MTNEQIATVACYVMFVLLLGYAFCAAFDLLLIELNKFADEKWLLSIGWDKCGRKEMRYSVFRNPNQAVSIIIGRGWITKRDVINIITTMEQVLDCEDDEFYGRCLTLQKLAAKRFKE